MRIAKSITVSLLLTGLAVLTSCSEEVVEEANKPSLQLVELAEVQVTDFTHKIRVQGNVETEKDALLSSEMSGLITSIKIKEGQEIKVGHTIATIDASILSKNIEELKSQLEYANYMLDKQKELSKRGVGSEFDLKAAQNQVNSLETKINTLGTQRGKSVLKAPFSGTVDQVYAKQGQVAGPQSPIARLVNNDEVYIVATISEKHLSSVEIGTSLEVSFPNFKSKNLELEITSIGNYIEPTNRTFRIRALVKNNQGLLPNMLAEISVTDLEVKGGIVIPTKSILKDNDNNDYIFIAKKKGNNYVVTKKSVTVVSRFEGNALISSESGLVQGEKVVTNGARGIDNNDSVRAE